MGDTCHFSLSLLFLPRIFRNAYILEQRKYIINIFPSSNVKICQIFTRKNQTAAPEKLADALPGIREKFFGFREQVIFISCADTIPFLSAHWTVTTAFLLSHSSSGRRPWKRWKQGTNVRYRYLFNQ
jgi:hypothetical protein